MTKRIGLFLVSRATGYQNFLDREAAAAAARAGFKFESFSADDTGAKQSTDVVKFLHTYRDDQLGVLIMPVSDVGHEQAVESLARKVLSRGAAWIVLNRDLADHVVKMREAFPGHPASLVTIDNIEIGRIQARQAAAQLPAQGGTVLYVLGNSATSAARDRRLGFLELMKARGASVAMVEGLWSAESAERVVSKWLGAQGSKEAVQVVACQNDPMAVGARRELNRLAGELGRPEWRRLPVLGTDGVPEEGRRLVDEGQLTATVVIPATSAAAVQRLAGAWNGQGELPAKVVLPAHAHP
jgi:ABC-type sugar transport system substrate-binding protein